MKVDYTKALIDVGGTEKCFNRHLRYCENCGQRYAIYSADSSLFLTYLTMYRNLIQCPTCGLYGTSAPLTDNGVFLDN